MHVVRKMYENFEAQILSGSLKPGTMLPSNRELAEKHGISPESANRIFSMLVKAGYVYRIQGRGSFVCDRLPAVHGSQLRIGIADSIVYSGNPLNDLVLNIWSRTIIKFLKENGVSYRLITHDETLDRTLLKQITSGLDGLLLCGNYLDPVVFANLELLSCPVVIYGYEFYQENLPFHQVFMNPCPGVKEVVKQIMKRSYPEIMVVREKHRNGVTRCKAFLQELGLAGYDMKKIRMIAVEQFALNNSIPSYRIGRMLAQNISGKLVFSTSDVVSAAMIDGFRDGGMEPGKDFELVSFDNLESAGFCPWKVPFMTSIDECPGDRACIAAELLLDVIRHPVKYQKTIAVPTKLVIRKTAFAEKILTQKNNSPFNERNKK